MLVYLRSTVCVKPHLIAFPLKPLSWTIKIRIHTELNLLWLRSLYMLLITSALLPGLLVWLLLTDTAHT